VLIGIALGLISYYFVTDFLAAREQRALRAEISGQAEGWDRPDRPMGPGETGWETWDEEDAAYWQSLHDGDIFGRIVIEKIGLDAVVVFGSGTADLKKGPGWIQYTDLPGQTGNVGIAGHRTTYGAPFRRLDELTVGDTINLYSPYRRYTYEVAEKKIVTPDQVEVMDSTPDSRLTLSACHPPFSARYRLIVQSTLIEMARLEGPAEAAGP
jgi:LPXTG-site transpeptidase (sortase) family protein